MNEVAGDIATTLEGVGSVRDAGIDTRTSVALMINGQVQQSEVARSLATCVD